MYLGAFVSLSLFARCNFKAYNLSLSIYHLELQPAATVLFFPTFYPRTEQQEEEARVEPQFLEFFNVPWILAGGSNLTGFWYELVKAKG